MPPGTGDVPLTVFQSLPVDGVVIVTSPQDLVQMIVKKAYNMAKKMDIPVLGIVENYSYLVCPDCGKKISVFGESHVDEVAEELDARRHIPPYRWPGGWKHGRRLLQEAGSLPESDQTS